MSTNNWKVNRHFFPNQPLECSLPAVMLDAPSISKELPHSRNPHFFSILKGWRELPAGDELKNEDESYLPNFDCYYISN